jgi:ketosteroid isomerase-like protein
MASDRYWKQITKEAVLEPDIVIQLRRQRPGQAGAAGSVDAGADVAFAVAILWCGPDSSSNPIDKDGFLFRLTVGLRKVDGDWRIAHEHHSVPASD